MAKCCRCHENEAVIYSQTLPQQGAAGDVHQQAESQGYCLPCALEIGLPGVHQALAAMGLSEADVPAVTEAINQMADMMGSIQPDELFQQMGQMASQISPEQLEAQFAQMAAFQQAFAEEDEEEDEAEEEQEEQPADASAEQQDEATLSALEDEASTSSTDSTQAEAAEGAAADQPDKATSASAKDDKRARWPGHRFPPKGESEKEKNKSDTASQATSNDEKKETEDKKKTAKDKPKEKPKAPRSSFQMMFAPFIPGMEMPQDGEELAFGEEITFGEAPERSNGKKKKSKRRHLEMYGTNLNRLAERGEIDPMIGREQELERVAQILNRRQKNNPVLIGEPGVGKTAIAQGLAARIVEGRVPFKLRKMEVYLLDMSALVAGTQFRGQFESRMKALVDEAKEHGNVILVIDELHNIMGAGDAEGAMNAANILKPALARGELRILGSTTLDEYRRYIEKDSALERRFQKVQVSEPDAETTLEILKGLLPCYEAYHRVRYPEAVLEESVRLSGRYISDRFFPDKAIDVLDEAGARVNARCQNDEEKERLQKEAELIEQERDRLAQELETKGDNEAEKLPLYEQQAELQSRALRVEAALKQVEAEAWPEVNKGDIAEVVELWTGIPLMSITESEAERLLRLEDRLHERIVGQHRAVEALARAIRRRRAALSKQKRPASFIFVGPTGVGKTELVKALADKLFGSEEALIRLDMSEYMEAHTVAKMIGSPPGYVGYDDGGQLTERVRRKPYSVLLLDEIEKAHPDVFNILLQILDDGRLSDAKGRTVDFQHTVIVMTSNAGTTLASSVLGFGRKEDQELESRVQQALRETFRPEFLNRVDEILIFQPLKKEEILQIVNLMLANLAKDLSEQGYALKVSKDCQEALAKVGYDPKFGARPLRKLLQRWIEDPLSESLLSGALADKKTIELSLEEGCQIEELQESADLEGKISFRFS